MCDVNKLVVVSNIANALATHRAFGSIYLQCRVSAVGPAVREVRRGILLYCHDCQNRRHCHHALPTSHREYSSASSSGMTGTVFLVTQGRAHYVLPELNVNKHAGTRHGGTSHAHLLHRLHKTLQHVAQSSLEIPYPLHLVAALTSQMSSLLTTDFVIASSA